MLIYIIISVLLSCGVAIRLKGTPLFYFALFCVLFTPANQFAHLIFHTYDYQYYIHSAIYVFLAASLPVWKKKHRAVIVLLGALWLINSFDPNILIIFSLIAIIAAIINMSITERRTDGIRIVYVMFILISFIAVLANITRLISTPYSNVMSLILIIVGYLLDIITILAGYDKFINTVQKPRARIDHSLLNTFTSREMDILLLLGEGLSSQAIADRLYLSKRTIDGHRASIKAKLGTSTVPEMCLYANELKNQVQVPIKVA